MKILILLYGLVLPCYSGVILLENNPKSENGKNASKVISTVKKALKRQELDVGIKNADSLNMDSLLTLQPSDYFCAIQVEAQGRLFGMHMVIRRFEKNISDTIKVTGKFKWAAQELALKAERYFSESALASLVISTSPDQARIEINEKFLGFSPAEIPMPAGKYSVIITKDEFVPVHQEIRLNPGDDVDIKHELVQIQKKYSTHRGWLWTSAAFSVASFAAQLINDKTYGDYMSLGRNASLAEFDDQYRNYQITNGIRNGLMAAAVVSLGFYMYIEW